MGKRKILSSCLLNSLSLLYRRWDLEQYRALNLDFGTWENSGLSSSFKYSLLAKHRAKCHSGTWKNTKLFLRFWDLKKFRSLPAPIKALRLGKNSRFLLLGIQRSEVRGVTVSTVFSTRVLGLEKFRNLPEALKLRKFQTLLFLQKQAAGEARCEVKTRNMIFIFWLSQ